MKNMWPLSAFLSFWVQHQHITEYHHLSSHLNRERKKTHVNDSKKKATQTINNNNRAMNSTQRKKSIYWISLSFRFKIFDQTKTRKSEKRMRQSTEPGGSLRKRIRMRSQFHSIDPHSWKILSFFTSFSNCFEVFSFSCIFGTKFGHLWASELPKVQIALLDAIQSRIEFPKKSLGWNSSHTLVLCTIFLFTRAENY